VSDLVDFLHVLLYNVVCCLLRRNKTMNFFSLMLRKRLRPDAEDDGDDGEEGKKGKKGSAKKGKLTCMAGNV
jgi:hypothetical protein